jgi:CDP-ribitol ribitolphosphotransferase / teichoic acid ribitol-phosphate polymerase
MTYNIISRNNKESYKVSVIIPVYNVEEYISETIDSVINQRFEDVEIIVVNDGSTDRSDEIIRNFLTKYDSIVYVKQENSGPGVARNTGIELSRGDFVCFLDSDDLLPEDALEVLYRAALEQESDLVTGASVSFSTKKKWFIYSHASQGVYNPGPKNLVTHPELLYSLGPCHKLFKRELINEIRFPAGIKVTEDHPFVIEAYLKARKIYTVEQIVYKYRRRESETNISLSQCVRFDAANALCDIMRSVSVSDPLWNRYLDNQDQQNSLKTYYYNRLLKSDIWPAIINTFRNQKDNNRAQIIEEVMEWATNLEPSVLLNLRKLGSGKRIDALKAGYRKQSFMPLKSRIFIERCWKLKNLIKNMIKRMIGSKLIFPVFRRRGIEDKVIFTSSKLTNLGLSWELLNDDLKRRWPGHEVKVWLQKSKSMKDYLDYLYDLATAKIIVVDDYSNPFDFIDHRAQTKVVERKALK